MCMVLSVLYVGMGGALGIYTLVAETWKIRWVLTKRKEELGLVRGESRSKKERGNKRTTSLNTKLFQAKYVLPPPSIRFLPRMASYLASL